MKQSIGAYCIVLLLLAPAGRPRDIDHHPNAQAELDRLLKRDETARKAGDNNERLKVALQIKDLMNDASDAVLLTAGAYSAVKDTAHAFAMLSTYADLGQADDNVCNGDNKKFQWLGNNATFNAICVRLQENKEPVSLVKTVFNIPDTALLPEDIDYDRSSKTFLFTSVLKKKIFRIDWGGRFSFFAASPSSWPIMAIKIDSLRKVVWATEVALHGFKIVPATDWDRSALLCYDLGNGRLIRRIEGPRGTALGDMVLDGKGRPVVSDGTNGGIYRLDGDSLGRIDRGDFISPQTIALAADRRHLIVPDYARGIGIFDLADSSVKWIRNSIAAKCPVNGIDGIYRDGEDLLLTQNGVNPEQVKAVRLDRGMNKIIGSTIVERDAALGDPTHGVVVDGNFYFIANAGWNTIDDSGQLRKGAIQSQAKVMCYSGAATSSAENSEPSFYR